ncbi:glycine cleavage system aminomethyltransferase GcvT [Acidianus sulfidivorans JP7]|uniref:aminomethyltransferase n=1 Tax=Acidianus sulfidivorans JP7 TaxID=619593 RepID=A0A2U9IP23_9CREN|nr:glycine cleavage system aminomethyltransferase GcvT [Acidianus sulfidivorans]AWR97737.1 glycine cleavage system aminomethyltransferase GcvT [Acidianus sulfidivorans JP7]
MFRTPLFNIEEKIGANFGEFAGWQMPMSFSSYIEEHMAVRQDCAFFDLSHMGRLRIRGKKDELDYIVSRNLNVDNFSMIGPSAMLNEKSGFVDDIMVYKVSDNEFLMVTNAINREKDIQWIKKNSSLEVEDLTFDYVMIAIQGRKIWNYIEKIDLQPLHFILNTKFLGEDVFLLSRSGWTGEDGIEVWADSKTGEKILTKLIELKIRPAGLITRDSLRQEMGFVLYGEDINEDINPVEARYWIFDLDKEFIGKNRLIETLTSGVSKYRVGFKLQKNLRFIPRHGSKIKILNQEIGEVTSSTFSPYLSRVIGMGYIKSQYPVMGYHVNIDIRGKEYRAKISDFPLL